VVVTPTLDNVPNGLAIDLQVSGKIPAGFATLITMRRPTGLAAALASENAKKKIRIRKNLLMKLFKVLMNSSSHNCGRLGTP
jgi:hypothetical protein